MLFKRVVHGVPLSFPETFQLETMSGKFIEAKTLRVEEAEKGLLRVTFEVPVLGHVTEQGHMLVGGLLINEMSRITVPGSIASLEIDQQRLEYTGSNPIVVSSNSAAYEPIVLENTERYMRALFLHQLEKCPICGKPMLTVPATIYVTDKNSEVWQMERLGAVKNGGFSKIGDERACEECQKSGRVTFVCQLCEEKRPTNLLQWDLGGDGLCTMCYETVTAKVWKEAKDKIRKAHRDDY